MKANFSLFISVLFLMGCSGSDNVDGLDFVESEEARIAFAESSVECENLNDCPDFSGGLISYQESTTTDEWGYTEDSYHIGVCSQQLIAPNKILTNRHCIPSNIDYKGASCSGKIYIKFPKTANFEAESVHCEKIVELSPTYHGENVAQLDWAILELKSPVKRPFVKQNSNGVPIDQKVKAYPVYYSSSTVYKDYESHTVAKGVIKANECNSTTSTHFGIYQHKESPIFIANKCDEKIISGNSGTGLLNAQNELIGVISFGLSEDYTKVDYSEDKSSVYLRQTIAGGTNLHCIDALNASQSPMCYYEEEAHQDLVSLAISAHVLDLYAKNFVELRGEIEEENLSKVYLGYSDASDDVHDLIVLSEPVFSNLPKSLVRASLYNGMGTVLPNFPSCVSDQAPDYFEEKLSFMDASRESNFTINSDSEISLDRDAMKIARFLLSYTKQDSGYLLQFVRASKAVLQEIADKESGLERSQLNCENDFLTDYFCSRYQREKREYKAWRTGLDISSEVLENEELFKNGAADFRAEVPLCE